MNKQSPPDLKDLVERVGNSNHNPPRGWYVNREALGMVENFWTGERWDGSSRTSGPLRRWFRRLTPQQQNRLFAAIFIGGFIIYLILTKDIESGDCRYGGGRFDYTC